ncbi:hypothetical protein [Streptomyces sp. JJ36]|uniref:hypothetical protein n=1 Tax=Streptomyces sp. JJ36 TaxID=2736645 RepID=UPI001F26B09C|nr:hypothetical protein [Streptomyces sp. JJ36]MCF6523785.1 hypothetical protein [Streptomyces sp. JJ36]
MANMSSAASNLATEAVLEVLASASTMDFALHKLGATRNRFPMHTGERWIDQIAWGIDSAYQIARFIFSGQFVGAAVVLRTQFERWTENAAYNCGVRHRAGESSGSFAARAWSHCHSSYPLSPVTLYEHVRKYGFELEEAIFPWENESHANEGRGLGVHLGDDKTVYPEQMMGELSEFLHGRGPWLPIVHWEAADLLGSNPPSFSDASSCLIDVMRLNLRQLRLCLATLAQEEQIPELPSRYLFALPDTLPAGDTPPPLMLLEPLLPRTGLQSDVLEYYAQIRSAHTEVLHRRRPAGRLYRDDEMAHLAFAERRSRAAHHALKALASEKRELGADFNLDGLEFRATKYVFAAEMAGLLAVWKHGEPQADAAATCSSVLRTASWLWLEDDDRALAQMRILLEQCARMRVWSLKPEKARRLEDSRQTTPKDWIIAAGWKRLNALNRALGEFAHAHARVRQDGAREILWKIQLDGAESSIRTARGHTMDALTAVTMLEAARAVKHVSPAIHEAFIALSEDMEVCDERVNELLDRVMRLRDASLGSYSFVGPAAEWRDQNSKQ